jgi:hypothetical protein
VLGHAVIRIGAVVAACGTRHCELLADEGAQVEVRPGAQVAVFGGDAGRWLVRSGVDEGLAIGQDALHLAEEFAVDLRQAGDAGFGQDRRGWEGQAEA